MLEIKNFSKTYTKGKKAVDNINLHIKPGEVFGFIGHNGAGKTTTIKSIVGILDFEEGEILIDGNSIKDDPIKCKSITAYIPDSPELYEQLTGIQYLNFICDIYKISTDRRKEDIEKYAKIFELAGRLGDLISSYSHGMKQKLALISALVRKPKLLVLDEPFVGLDPKASFLVKEIMKEMCKEGSSIFFSTHILEVAEKLCDHVAIIKNGKIIAYGTMDDVKGDKSLEDVFLETANE
ncbi:MAG TPA: ABC transporter ATP-binding protein [Acholeplasmataceae bacterium]|nr:ABC transporter ATP-binding protein [Acholeplasmataceae bacterium]